MSLLIHLVQEPQSRVIVFEYNYYKPVLLQVVAPLQIVEGDVRALVTLLPTKGCWCNWSMDMGI